MPLYGDGRFIRRDNLREVVMDKRRCWCGKRYLEADEWKVWVAGRPVCNPDCFMDAEKKVREERTLRRTPEFDEEGK